VSVAPSSSVTVNSIVYVPAVSYLWVGLVRVDVWPSPKFQRHAVSWPSKSWEPSVKWISSAIDGFDGE